MSQQLTIEPLGATIEVEDGQTILDAALRQGIYIPHACGHGLCGTCKVQIVEGEVDHGAANPFALMDFERDEGKALACCATLLSDADIEADVDEDPDARIIPVTDFDTTVSRIETLTPTIKAIWLKLDKPIDFQAGQYVQITLPGIEGDRPFSIANSPEEIARTGELEINVRTIEKDRGNELCCRNRLCDVKNSGDKTKYGGDANRTSHCCNFARKSKIERFHRRIFLVEIVETMPT